MRGRRELASSVVALLLLAPAALLSLALSSCVRFDRGQIAVAQPPRPVFASPATVERLAYPPRLSNATADCFPPVTSVATSISPRLKDRVFVEDTTSPPGESRQSGHRLSNVESWCAPNPTSTRLRTNSFSVANR